uniref:molybdopterin cofactor-binding domain-containing protein n=1 Tax=Fusobacterium ulcerans TaxID=861 RepID=UPI0026EDFABC
MSKKYIYISREQAKQGLSCVFKVADEPVQNMAEYFEGKACLYVGEDLSHFITYIPELDTVREATEEEKLARKQRKLAENEFLKDGKIVSYDPYSQKVVGDEIVEKTREDYIQERIITLETEKEKVDFDGSFVYCTEEEEKKVSLEQVALKSTFFNNIELQAVKEHSSPISPPPFMVGMAEVEVDKETGTVELLDYVAVVDCGTPINPN